MLSSRLSRFSVQTALHQLRNQVEAVSDLRAALFERSFSTAKWWGYSASHQYFMLLLGKISCCCLANFRQRSSCLPLVVKSATCERACDCAAPFFSWSMGD